MSSEVNKLQNVGNTRAPYMQTVLSGSFPEFPILSTDGIPRPPVAFPKWSPKHE